MPTDDASPRPTIPASIAASRDALIALIGLLDSLGPNPADGSEDFFDPEALLELMASMGEASHEFDTVFRQLAAMAGLNSATARLRAYFLAHVGEVVTTYQLNGVSGIQESPRRIRELRVQEGMQITAGPGHGLKSGEYRLEATDADVAAAERWRMRNQVRRTEGSIKDRCLLLLRTLYPEGASKEDLMYVARAQEWPRRIRELAEDGWDVLSQNDDPSMAVGSYRLGSLEKGIARSRQAIKQRVQILKRDGFACTSCGASKGNPTGTVLQIHHKRHVSEGGGNTDDNLVTLCSNCHAGEHAEDGVSSVSDELLRPGDNPWAAES